jgi:Txe/YoeB family toxin of Txe-Axe toxin-antitoxin module
MPVICELRDDLKEYLKAHNLSKKWVKAKKLFEQNPEHPSLNTELLEPRHRLIYSFRLDKKYRALFICISDQVIEVIAVTNHYKK